MKIAVILLLVIFSLKWDTTEPAPGVFGLLGRIGSQAVKIIPKVTAVGPKMTTAVTKYFPKVFKGFGNLGKRVLVSTRKFGSKVGQSTKAKFLGGFAATGKILKNTGIKTKTFAKRTGEALKKCFKKPSNKNEAASMATDLNLPFDSNGAPLSGGPGEPPKKKSKFAAVAKGVAKGVGVAAETSAQITGIAFQVQSLKALNNLGNPASQTNTNQLGEGTSNRALAIAGATCPVIPNTFTSKADTTCQITISDDDSDDDLSPITHKLKFSDTLILTYKDEPVRKGADFCRKDLTNLADKRASYVQAFQLKPLSKVGNSDIEVNREAALNCNDKNKIPLCTLRQGVKRSSRPNVMTVPEVTTKGVTTLAWQGMLNDVGGAILNTCHMDSFFTHINIIAKQDPTFFDRNFLIPQNGAEAIVKEIGLLYKNLPNKVTVNGLQTAHCNWKKLWIKTGSWQHGKMIDEKKTVDFKGHESDSIMYRLASSSNKIYTFVCGCQGDKKIVAKHNGYYIFTIEQIVTISRVNQDPSEYNKPLGFALTDKDFKWCRGCSDYTINFIFVPTTTWMLYWLLPPQKHLGQYSKEGGGKPYVFDVNKAPKKFIVHELFFDEHIVFELAYISLSTTRMAANVFHHVSFHFFNNKFYYYNDMEKGLLVQVKDPNNVISSKSLTIESLIYFRP